MSVTIKTAREIELMREAGRLLEKVHRRKTYQEPGLHT